MMLLSKINIPEWKTEKKRKWLAFFTPVKTQRKEREQRKYREQNRDKERKKQLLLLVSALSAGNSSSISLVVVVDVWIQLHYFTTLLLFFKKMKKTFLLFESPEPFTAAVHIRRWLRDKVPAFSSGGREIKSWLGRHLSKSGLFLVQSVTFLVGHS